MKILKNDDFGLLVIQLENDFIETKICQES